MGADQTGPMVTVAVVSWNTRELLVRCLDSLASEVQAGRADVWVVDNGSSDGSASRAREHAPWAQVIEPGEISASAAAVNLVAARTVREWIACANADVALAPGALAALLGAGADPRVGCVAPRLCCPMTARVSTRLSAADADVHARVQPRPTAPGAGSIGDRWCLEGYWDPERPRAVPWAIGAFLLLRRSAFAAVGGFDERQWMYAEDLDLGWRLHDAGWLTRYEPAARVRHAAGRGHRQRLRRQRALQRFMRATYAVMFAAAGAADARHRGGQRARGRGQGWVDDPAGLVAQALARSPR